MTANGEAFIEWALAGERTVEERFSTLVLVEHLAREYKYWTWEQRRLTWEARRYNPAWEPELDAAEVRKAAEKLDALKTLSLQNHDDRLVRSLEVLRFLPNLRELHDIGGTTDLEPLRHVPGLVNLSMGTLLEATDLSPLRRLTELRTLTLGSKVLEDYRPVALCRKLKSVRVYCRYPWPRMEGWEELSELRELRWTGSCLGFLGLKRLPALRWLEVKCGSVHGTEGCMRDLHQLPEMPELRVLWALHFFHMDGIERYPKLQAALVAGHFRTAAPAAMLPELTHLRLWSDELREVRSLAAAPALHQLVVHGKRPQDYSPLSEAPQLREVMAFGCTTPQVDLDMLRVLLPDWDEYFLATEPRELPELTWVVERQAEINPDAPPPPPPPPAPPPWKGEPWERNPCFQQSASRWAYRRLRAALDARGLENDHGFFIAGFDRCEKRWEENGYSWMSEPRPANRCLQMSLLGTRALGHLRDVVACVRAFFATLRHPWELVILGTPTPDDDDWERGWVTEETEDDRRREEREREVQREKEQELLAQELRLNLLREEGLEPDPKEFGLKPPPGKEGRGPGKVTTAQKPETPPDGDDVNEKPPVSFEEPDLDWNNRDKENDAEGGLKEADPTDENNDEHWLPPPPNVEPNTFWKSLNLYLRLTEHELRVPERSESTVRYLMSLDAGEG
ncbi:MAG: hypothetical protein K1X78_13785 [Verrucomicrobiaceae bacterium]|nr:hypothetical protein [Verrucomicrobiaceae bacterium]